MLGRRLMFAKHSTLTNRCSMFAWFGLMSVAITTVSQADSALKFLSGFDHTRVEQCYPISDSDVAAEMGKLLYRLQNVGDGRLASLSQSWEVASGTDPNGRATLEVGDAVRVEGHIEAIRQFNLPDDLAEYLDMNAYQEIVFRQQKGTSVSIFAPPLNGKIAKGDRVTAHAVYLGTGDRDSDEEGTNPPTIAFATGKLSWFPSNPDRAGWQMLSDVGFDLSLIADAASRNRFVLKAEDAPAFYGLLAAAAKASPKQPAKAVDPVALLTRASEYHGEWIKINASTVRITRIALDSESQREQLGQDYYFQIDASGDLGKRILQLERAEGESGDPIRMSGSYPVTFVATRLPEFLRQEFERQNSLVAIVSHPVVVEGFFYRLWSYSNEFMTREGGGKQVGPLIVASRWTSRIDPNLKKQSGIAWFGYALAALIFGAVLVTLWWQIKTARHDAAIRARNRESISIEIPGQALASEESTTRR